VKITGMNPEEKLDPEVAPRAYYRQPVWKRVVVILAGPLVNLVLAVVIVWALILSSGVPRDLMGVYSLEPASPAAAVLHINDRLLAVDGQTLYRPRMSRAQFVAATGQMRVLLDRHRCAGRPTPGCAAATPMSLAVGRGSRVLALTAYPRYDAATKRMRLGFAFGLHRYLGVVDAGGQSLSVLWQVTTQTIDAVGTRFTNPSDHRLSGVIGAYETTRQAVKFGVADAFWVLAVISLSLAVINLFPFLPLDGGHVFWAVAEKLRRRPIPFAAMQRASVVGVVLVVYFAITGLSSDLYHLQHGGFGVR
jgi:regulator of sigma E protease